MIDSIKYEENTLKQASTHPVIVQVVRECVYMTRDT
jgi:hypothetical protein